MKRFLILFAAFVGCVAVSVGQTNFVATLQHEGEFSHYYGQGALTEAYKAAVDGDIITLSPGTFTWSGNFEKGITLRGNGQDAPDKTFISGEINFYSRSSNLETILEGIRFNNTVTIYNDASSSAQGKMTFIKTFNVNIYTRTNGNNPQSAGPTVRIYNSYIQGMYFYTPSVDVVVYNSFVGNPISSSNIGENNINFINCTIQHNKSGGYSAGVVTYISQAYYLNFYNCIFFPGGLNDGEKLHDDYVRIPSTGSCYNCLSLVAQKLFENLSAKGNNWYASTTSEVLPNGQLSELTDEAKSKYIGTDGTEIGLHGGLYPWNTTVQYPTITTFNVESRTSEEGVLGIEVGVDGK